MTPAARVSAAIEIVDLWQSADEGLDIVLTRWGRNNRYAGSGDRHAIADLVYDAVRRRRSAAWLAGADEDPGGRDLMIGSLLLDRMVLQDVFSGGRYAPAPLTEREQSRLRTTLEAAPRGVRLDWPDWLMPHVSGLADESLGALRQRAPLDLRVNTLQGSIDGARSALRSEGIDTVPVLSAPHCLRVQTGARRVARSAAYTRGLVEIQDAASQRVVEYANPAPGETVLDLCAGAGGKSLAIAAKLQTEGRILASDISDARLAQLSPRAERAGARVECVPASALGALEQLCDLVLIDAPCSGSGAWRRNPDAKWRLHEADLARLIDLQARLLDKATQFLREGGRIVYATCSILAPENTSQIGSFLRRNPHWEAAEAPLELQPGENGDGFFSQILRRKRCSPKN